MVLIHHLSKAQVMELAAVFAKPVFEEGQDVTITWEVPAWIEVMLEHCYD